MAAYVPVCVHNLPRSISMRCHQTHGKKTKAKYQWVMHRLFFFFFFFFVAIRQMKLSMPPVIEYVCNLVAFSMCSIIALMFSIYMVMLLFIVHVCLYGCVRASVRFSFLCDAPDTSHTVSIHVYLFYGTISMSSSSHIDLLPVLGCARYSTAQHSTQWSHDLTVAIWAICQLSTPTTERKQLEANKNDTRNISFDMVIFFF